MIIISKTKCNTISISIRLVLVTSEISKK